MEYWYLELFKRLSDLHYTGSLESDDTAAMLEICGVT